METGRITLGLGYYIQDFETVDENKEGWLVNSEIYKRWTFRSSYIDLTGSSGQKIDDTGTRDMGLNIYYSGRLDAGHIFSPRFSGSIYGSYRHDDYPNQDPGGTTQALGAGAGVTFQALQWMFIDLKYDYRNFLSDELTDEYTENRVTLMITLKPTRPYRLN
jgi:hypothetical protein